VIESRFRSLKRSGKAEDGVTMLDGHYAAGGKRLSVPYAIHQKHDWAAHIACAQEITMQGVYGAIFRHCLRRRRQRLPEHLTPENLSPPEVLALAAEDILLDTLELE
jgi:hypothetical protein